MSGSCHTKDVPEFCTCGAQLPPDARFCHKCAKPQYDDPAFHQEIEAPAPLPPPLPVVPSINFRNRVAVRAGFVAAVLGLMLSMIPLPFMEVRMLITLVAAGVLAAYLYRRGSGQALTVGGGARVGWITGIFVFAMALILIIAALLIITSSDSKVIEAVRSQMPSNQAEALSKAMQDPASMVGSVLFSLIPLTVLPILGGALCAKFLEKE